MCSVVIPSLVVYCLTLSFVALEEGELIQTVYPSLLPSLPLLNSCYSNSRSRSHSHSHSHSYSHSIPFSYLTFPAHQDLRT